MKNKAGVLVGAGLALVLLAYMFTFQVRYDEVAVVSTFGKATEPLRNEAGEIKRDGAGKVEQPGSVKFEPGLCLRLPWPVQNVTKYSSRLQILEDELRQTPTKDNKSLVVKTYMTWRITDPHRFFISLQDWAKAEQLLRQLLNDEIKGQITQHNMDQMVNFEPGKIKLADMETAATKGLQARVAKLDYGVSVAHVGINRLELPQDNTQAVFDRMNSVRDRLAKDAREQGKAQAAAIKAQARSARERILAFTEARALAIRTKGANEAAAYYEQFAKNQELAIFLRRIETLREVLANNTTFVLDAGQLSMQSLFGLEPTSPLPAPTPSISPAAAPAPAPAPAAKP